MTKIIKSQVLSLFSQKVSGSEIARLLGISRQRVSQILKEEQEEEKKKKLEREKRKEQIKQEMLQLKNMGLTYQQIATELNISIGWVSNVLRESSPKKGTRKKEHLARFMACCCCGSRWVETIKESPSTNCPICFSSCKEIQKIYDKETLETLEKYAQKFYK